VSISSRRRFLKTSAPPAERSACRFLHQCLDEQGHLAGPAGAAPLVPEEGQGYLIASFGERAFSPQAATYRSKI
jgi:hypothetical protein